MTEDCPAQPVTTAWGQASLSPSLHLKGGSSGQPSQLCSWRKSYLWPLVDFWWRNLLARPTDGTGMI
jgi:hypothetical protein